MHSAIYQGKLLHRRMEPKWHSFDYTLFMMYIDLAELPSVFANSWLFSASGRAAARFYREDHLGDPTMTLDQAVRDLVMQETGSRPSGPIRLLTHLRYFGYVFNPVSFYYCFDEEDSKVETIVAEVNNTPWGERHCYVLDNSSDHGNGSIRRYMPPKQMHVSPFMPMDVDYDWRFGAPDEVLTVHMANMREGRKLFDATLVLQRREISPSALTAVLLKFPLMTLKVIAGVHWQALRLWLKGVSFHDHPGLRKKGL